MKQLGLSYFTDLHVTLIGLLLFIVVFATISFWVLKMITTEQVDRWSRLPLDSDSSSEPKTGSHP
ncbi:MAG: cbb3-type cytochrome c oxidase subunit 3 [Bdellovibrionales bacterium]|nr:cbb3-type cytochrome c oxidase subunit 3 [Bdellovibrionales bacterium]